MIPYLGVWIGSPIVTGSIFGIYVCRNGYVFSFDLCEASGFSLTKNGFDDIWIVGLPLTCGRESFGQISFIISCGCNQKPGLWRIYGARVKSWMHRIAGTFSSWFCVGCF
ncbi:hypothetical protein V6N12_010767 [Hibiscus sabdariffa]|uniref:Uncharacterized protein n=1 Tax=Hibiscus sabdariffa TaxID=183260 RepID=A0ABR2EPY1_9ROSI